MNSLIANKLREAEAKLEMRFPKKIFDCFRKLESSELVFGDSKWLFPLVETHPGNVLENFIITNSEAFNNIWKTKGMVFALNKSGDSLLFLQGKQSQLLKEIFVLTQDSQEIKIFNYSLEKLLLHGPLDYANWDDFYLKLANGKVIKGGEYKEGGSAED